MNEELQTTILRLLRLVNGLLAMVYLAGFAWMLAQLYQMII
jgi:hypothetical protein